MEAATHTLQRGDSPLIISVPHAGTAVPEDLLAQFTPLALTIPDTDWHVPLLYDFAPAMGATLLVARYSRYLIDLNRPPDDAALYGGAVSTGLCPTASFAGAALYRDGATTLPPAEIARRRARYWQPYHETLRHLIDATRARHGYALLLDAHSIRSRVPRLFEGRLPDVNVGTYDGRACAAAVAAALRAPLLAAPRFTQVFDGRFKGGHITRHYGQPGQRVHALQIELAQQAYMAEPDDDALTAPGFDAARAAPLRAVLQGIVAALLALRPPQV